MSKIKPELFFRDLFEQTGDLIHILNLEGQIIIVNPSWLLHLGYTLEEVYLRSIYDFINPDHHERYRNNRKEVITGLGFRELEFELVNKLVSCHIYFVV